MDKVPSQSSTRPRFRYASMDERMRLQHQHLHQRLQIRKQAPQSKLRELHPKGSRSLLCAGDAENANQPGFPLNRKFSIEQGI